MIDLTSRWRCAGTTIAAALALLIAGITGCAPVRRPPRRGMGARSLASPRKPSLWLTMFWNSVFPIRVGEAEVDRRGDEGVQRWRQSHRFEEAHPGAGRSDGFGELITEIQEGRLKGHLASPASSVFIELGNAESKTRTGKPLIGETRNLVVSPVVIAMWKPMAEVLGWGKRPVGWADILRIAKDDQGWAKYNYPQWGRFKFGHTHPEYSNSGIIAVLRRGLRGGEQHERPDRGETSPGPMWANFSTASRGR